MSDSSSLDRAAELVRGALQRYLLSKGFKKNDAEDIIQEAFLRMFQKVTTGTLREDNLADPQQMRAYLLRSVQLISLERFRERNIPVENVAEDVSSDAGAGRLKGQQQEAEDKIMRNARAQLDEEDRDLIDRWLRNESEEAAAARLKVSIAAVKMRRHRVKKQLMKYARDSEEWRKLENLKALAEERSMK